MKISYQLIPKTEEEKIVFHVHEITDEIREKASRIENAPKKELLAYIGKHAHLVAIKEILYIESVDKRTFLYTKEEVYEVQKKLYQMEEMLEEQRFIRVSKSTLLNWRKIKCFIPTLYGRFEAQLENDERVVISRKYAPNLKRVLGIGGKKS